jgi:hypothetical protein
VGARLKLCALAGDLLVPHRPNQHSACSAPSEALRHGEGEESERDRDAMVVKRLSSNLSLDVNICNYWREWRYSVTTMRGVDRRWNIGGDYRIPDLVMLFTL